ncbi:MAG: DUF3501 family protein [Proteobacteria bacterium]|nr:DUF3501 family protein [Pseudomonadota bacterium]MDA1323254.1 DUF3501 family protein [Pseudomonadota bacterium]
MKHQISREDLIPLDQYARERRDHARRIAELKKNRRVSIGPDATFYFESFETMWFQIHEMLHIEKGGEEQVAGELEAYNPLVPNGRELVATMMIEIPDPDRRAAVLARLGGIEETATLTIDGEAIEGVPEEDADRTNAAGKASSVQFIHFPFTDAQVAAFHRPGTDVVLALSHTDYRHMAGLPEDVRAALAVDLD